jgi:hypothetical protein
MYVYLLKVNTYYKVSYCKLAEYTEIYTKPPSVTGHLDYFVKFPGNNYLKNFRGVPILSVEKHDSSKYRVVLAQKEPQCGSGFTYRGLTTLNSHFF